MKVAIAFGALADPIYKQLEQHGLKAATPSIQLWQADADAITRLAVRDLLTAAMVRAARKKLLKDILHKTSTRNKEAR